MKIIIYQTETEGAKKFLAHVELARDCYMSFFGSTSEAATQRAKSWYARERARQFNLEAGLDRNRDNPENIAGINPSHAALNPGGRGAHFLGKVWMIHEISREKIRVDEGQVAEYQNQGYVKGGPRSK